MDKLILTKKETLIFISKVFGVQIDQTVLSVSMIYPFILEIVQVRSKLINTIKTTLEIIFKNILFLVKPPVAFVRHEDCSFERGICGWENITLSTNDRTVTWQRAFLTHRPAQLLDKTFGATGDYIFFDIFTTDQKSTEVRLRSPIIGASFDDQATCFTFWFAAFGVEESTMLEIIKTTINEDTNGSSDENGNDEMLVSIGYDFKNIIFIFICFIRNFVYSCGL